MISRAGRLAVVILGLGSITNGALRAQGCTGTGAAHVLPPSGHSRDPEMSAADRTAIETTLAAVEQTIRKTPFGTPRGYEARSKWMYNAPPDRTRLSSYAFQLNLWCPSIKASFGEGEPGLTVFINPSPGEWSVGAASARDDKGIAIYFERVHSATRFGSIATFGEFEEANGTGLRVLFTRGDVSPTLPVSREEYLRHMIWEVEGQEAGKKSAYQEWLEQAPDRKKSNDEVIALTAKTDPKKAEELRKTLEKAERDNAALMRQTDSSGAALRTNGANRYRAQIAAMSPAERALPAVVSGDNFVAPGYFDAHAVVRENPAFYRAVRSPTEPRAVLVWLPHGYDRPLKDVRAQLYREFDWAEIKRLVSGPSP